ncbi:MAG: nicotinate-nucleotide--dimethylbenzimidazole phosphoribosyltransferase [Egibacteraceae bacterium]
MCASGGRPADVEADALAKPGGSLDALERLGAQLWGIAGRCSPPVPREPAIVVAAGDHGVHVQGVSRWSAAGHGPRWWNCSAGPGPAVNAIAGTVGR